jgi:hypothetical protein
VDDIPVYGPAIESLGSSSVVNFELTKKIKTQHNIIGGLGINDTSHRMMSQSAWLGLALAT